MIDSPSLPCQGFILIVNYSLFILWGINPKSLEDYPSQLDILETAIPSMKHL